MEINTASSPLYDRDRQTPWTDSGSVSTSRGWLVVGLMRVECEDLSERIRASAWLEFLQSAGTFSSTGCSFVSIRCSTEQLNEMVEWPILDSGWGQKPGRRLYRLRVNANHFWVPFNGSPRVTLDLCCTILLKLCAAKSLETWPYIGRRGLKVVHVAK